MDYDHNVIRYIQPTSLSNQKLGLLEVISYLCRDMLQSIDDGSYSVSKEGIEAIESISNASFHLYFYGQPNNTNLVDKSDSNTVKAKEEGIKTLEEYTSLLKSMRVDVDFSYLIECTTKFKDLMMRDDIYHIVETIVPRRKEDEK